MPTYARAHVCQSRPSEPPKAMMRMAGTGVTVVDRGPEIDSSDAAAGPLTQSGSLALRGTSRRRRLGASAGSAAPASTPVPAEFKEFMPSELPLIKADAAHVLHASCLHLVQTQPVMLADRVRPLAHRRCHVTACAAAGTTSSAVVVDGARVETVHGA